MAKFILSNNKFIKSNSKMVLGGGSGPTPIGETWVIKNSFSVSGTFNTSETISFVSNNETFSEIEIRSSVRESSYNILYTNGSYPLGLVVYSSESPAPGVEAGWLEQAYRTVTFATAPTGDLLTWLQNNAEKQ